MGELTFIGLGLNDETDVSLKGLEKAKTADAIFAELYTSFMPELNLRRLETLIGKPVQIVSRRDLEDDEGIKILKAAEIGRAVLLVPGDPLIATTHIDLRIRAHKKGVRTSVVHGASIVSSVIGLSGLQNYKFGRSVTIPFAEVNAVSETPYNVIAENKKLGLHTLCFLDIKAEEKRYMTAKDGLKTLVEMEERKKQDVITAKTLVIGVARAGSETPTVKCDFLRELEKFDFGEPPHSLVFPGRLHFMEAEALVTFSGAPKQVRETAR